MGFKARLFCIYFFAALGVLLGLMACYLTPLPASLIWAYGGFASFAVMGGFMTYNRDMNRMEILQIELSILLRELQRLHLQMKD